MMSISHLLAVLLLAYVTARFREWTVEDTWLALGFGWLIDLDHAVQVPVFVGSHDLTAMSLDQALSWGSAWQGAMHTPWGLVVVIAAVVTYRSWVPALFWFLHMVQDFYIATEWVVFGSPLEWAIVALMAGSLATIAVWQARVEAPGTGAVRFWRRRLRSLVPVRV